MSTLRCTTKCQWRGRLWKIGDTVNIGAGEPMPPPSFFEKLELEEPQPQPQEDKPVKPPTRKKGENE